MQDDLSQALDALQLADDTATPASGKMILPADIMSIILGYCDRATCLAVLYTCKSYHQIAIPYVYKKITLWTPKQLQGFISTSQQAAYDDRVARRFYHTRSFFYRIKQGSPASSSSKVKMPKLYTNLRQVASHTSDGKILFPNLDTASFEQVPQKTDSDESWPNKPTFLSNVKIVHLEHSPLSLYDCPPDFGILGLRDVREVHMYHLAGCEISHQSLLRSHMDYQGSLKKIHFHLAGHFENTVCSDQHTSRVHTLVNGILLPTGATRIRRSFDTTIYINEYAAAISKLATSVAYAQISAASRPHPVYPSLKQVIIDVGADRKSSSAATNVPQQLTGDAVNGNASQQLPGDVVDENASQQFPGNIIEECTDRQLMVKRCKAELLRCRDRAEQRLMQASHSPEQTSGNIILPEIWLIQGERDPIWKLYAPNISP